MRGVAGSIARGSAVALGGPAGAAGFRPQVFGGFFARPFVNAVCPLHSLISCGDCWRTARQPSGTLGRLPGEIFGSLPYLIYVGVLGVHAHKGRGGAPMLFQDRATPAYPSFSPSLPEHSSKALGHLGGISCSKVPVLLFKESTIADW